MNAKKKTTTKESQPTHKTMSDSDRSASIKRGERFGGITVLLDFFKDRESAVGFFNFIRTLSGDDIVRLFDAVSQLVRIKEPLSSRSGVLLRVEAALKLAEAFADMTPGHRDDEFVEKTKLLLNAGLLPVIADVVAGLLSHLKGTDDADEVVISNVITGPQTDVLILENGISWSVLVPIINTIIQIIRAVTKD